LSDYHNVFDKMTPKAIIEIKTEYDKTDEVLNNLKSFGVKESYKIKRGPNDIIAIVYANDEKSLEEKLNSIRKLDKIKSTCTEIVDEDTKK